MAGSKAAGLSQIEWSLLIAASTVLAGLFLLYGQRLQEWLMRRVLENEN